MKMQDDKYFKTTDFCLASFLVAKNVDLIGINKDSNNRGTFLFTNDKSCLNLVSDFTQMKSSVEPLSFHAAMKRLKQLLYINK